MRSSLRRQNKEKDLLLLLLVSNLQSRSYEILRETKSTKPLKEEKWDCKLQL
jgi:hypothetical protein